MKSCKALKTAVKRYTKPKQTITPYNSHKKPYKNAKHLAVREEAGGCLLQEKRASCTIYDTLKGDRLLLYQGPLKMQYCAWRSRAYLALDTQRPYLYFRAQPPLDCQESTKPQLQSCFVVVVQGGILPNPRSGKPNLGEVDLAFLACFCRANYPNFRS